ncbi:MAG: NAD(P)-binding protein [Rhodobacteraceae bacterium]|nr:NAD(P)-binding protein [Paracoccaceae bacterium]
MTIAVIGAGIAGVAAALDLQDAGHDVTVFDKSRGLGGRLATRRDAAISLDHGAPGVVAHDAAFAAALARAGGAVCPDYGFVGQPGMSSLVKGLADGIAVSNSVEIASVDPTRNGIVLTDQTGGEHGGFDRVVMAVPAPQARVLARDFPQADSALAAVVMAPVWSLLLAFDTAQHLTGATSPVFDAVVHNSGKPGRAETPDTWVAHATPEWTRAHLEDPRDKVLEALTSAFAGLSAAPLPTPIYHTVHRWRYARCERPLGAPFVEALGGRLVIGGDWALGSEAEDAWRSGKAMAQALLA